MNVIYKYEINTFDRLSLPVGAKILDIQYQDNNLVLWAMVDTEVTEKEDINIVVYGTGWDVDNAESLTHIKTIQDMKGFVWHLFLEK